MKCKRLRTIVLIHGKSTSLEAETTADAESGLELRRVAADRDPDSGLELGM